MGHGTTNSILLNAQPAAEERALIKEAVTAVRQERWPRKAPRGWLGPAT